MSMLVSIRRVLVVCCMDWGARFSIIVAILSGQSGLLSSTMRTRLVHRIPIFTSVRMIVTVTIGILPLLLIMTIPRPSRMARVLESSRISPGRPMRMVIMVIMMVMMIRRIRIRMRSRTRTLPTLHLRIRREYHRSEAIEQIDESPPYFLLCRVL